MVITQQATQYAKQYKVFFKRSKLKKRYEHLPPMNIAELKPWNMVHIYLIGPYNKTVQQLQPGNLIKDVYLNSTCMTFIYPCTRWYGIAQVTYFYIEEIENDNREYIEKTSARSSQLFNNT